MPTIIRRRSRRPQLETSTPIVALAIARQVVEEASLWLGTPLPGRYAAGLAHRARRVFAHSELYRPRFAAAGDAGRDRLYVFMRHWLAARLAAERPALFVRLPRSYCTGEPLPARPVALEQMETFLSNEARLLCAF
jgi:hypothetical protein